MEEEVLTAEKLHDLRRQVLSNTEYSRDTLKRAVRQLVGDRIAQAQESAVMSRRRPARTKVNLDDLLPDDKKVDLSDLT